MVYSHVRHRAKLESMGRLILHTIVCDNIYRKAREYIWLIMHTEYTLPSYKRDFVYYVILSHNT